MIAFDPVIHLHQGKENSSSILLIYTGGTIGMDYQEGESQLVPFPFDHMLLRIPEIQSLSVSLSVVQASSPIDSSNIKPEDWIKIASLISNNYAQYDGFVVLHGTDTMAFTASAISFLLEGLHKPIIFTGAQLPLGERRSDGRENLLTAMEICSERTKGKPRVQEVCIFFGGLLLRANRAKKTESNFFDAFNSENYPTLAEAGVSIIFKDNFLFRSNLSFKCFDQLESNVLLIKLFPGLRYDLISQALQNHRLQGVVLETYGSGNAPNDPAFCRLLEELYERQVVVYNVSQCPGGTVMQGKYATSKHLLDKGVIGGSDLTTEAALTKLMFVLGNFKDSKEQISLLKQDLRGEMTQI